MEFVSWVHLLQLSLWEKVSLWKADPVTMLVMYLCSLIRAVPCGVRGQHVYLHTSPISSCLPEELASGWTWARPCSWQPWGCVAECLWCCTVLHWEDGIGFTTFLQPIANWSRTVHLCELMEVTDGESGGRCPRASVGSANWRLCCSCSACWWQQGWGFMLTSVPELVTMEAGSVVMVSAFFLRHHSSGISCTVWG